MWVTEWAGAGEIHMEDQEATEVSTHQASPEEVDKEAGYLSWKIKISTLASFVHFNWNNTQKIDNFVHME